MERAELVAQALVFLVRLTGEDVPLDEAMKALSALAEAVRSNQSWLPVQNSRYALDPPARRPLLCPVNSSHEL